MTLERRYRDKKAAGRRQEGGEGRGGGERSGGRRQKSKRYKKAKLPWKRWKRVPRGLVAGVQARSSDRPVCLVVRKLMDALKDTQKACVARRRL